jgi:hypothetical protein
LSFEVDSFDDSGGIHDNVEPVVPVLATVECFLDLVEAEVAITEEMLTRTQ